MSMRLLSLAIPLTLGVACAQQGYDGAKPPFTKQPCSGRYCVGNGYEKLGSSYYYWYSLIENEDAPGNPKTLHRLSYGINQNKLSSISLDFPPTIKPKIEEWQQQMLVDTFAEVAGYKTTKANVKKNCYDAVMVKNAETPLLFHQMKTGKKFSVLCTRYTDDGGEVFNVQFLQNWHPKPDPGERRP